MKKLLSVATVMCLGSLSCNMASGMNTNNDYNQQVAQCTQHVFDRAKQMHDQGNDGEVKNIVAIECQNTDVLRDLLWLAVHNNYSWLAEEIFSQYGSQIKVDDWRNYDGRTLLMQAVMNDDTDMMTLLIANDANIFDADDEPILDNKGNGVIYYAVVKGGRVLDLLHLNGVDFNAPCSGSKVPLVVAYETNKAAFKKMISWEEIDVNIEVGNHNYLLRRLIEDNNFDSFKVLVNRPDINLEVTDVLKQTPLLLAIFQNELDFVKQLIEHGADVTAKDCSGDGIWHNVQIDHCVTEVFKYLLTIPAAVRIINEQDWIGITVLHKAALAGNNDAVKLLCQQQNIDFSKRDNFFNKTALDIAKKEGHPEIAQIIIEAMNRQRQ